MPDELITIFKICFLVLLYLFFFRVLRAVWTEVGAAAAPVGADPTPIPTSAKEKRSERRAREKAERAVATVPTLLVVEPPAMAGVEYTLVEGLSVGRGGDADIVLDDTFLSTRHASFEQHDGHWTVVDHGSTNGTFVNGARVEGSAYISAGDRLQLGGLIVEVR